ncbi:MAG: ATP-dependent DNA helicase [Gammaproteobacteria bacterium]|nr:ATP-dependent DNA helicase [Gammaproteobacteria bacterium]
MQSPAELLGPDGPLAKRISGFAPRAAQQEMAEAIAQVFDDYGLLISEAGTGTGKTYAYLVPAILSGKKVIISTGTKNLQDQLFHRDLPVVRNALGVPLRAALLKGRANYLCLHRLELAELDGRGHTRENRAMLQRIKEWAGRTRSGDVAEVVDVPEDSPLWFQVTSTTDNCLGQECPVYSDCHIMKARRAAQEADLVVINHHLLFADMALKDEGFGELLPGANAFIIDEAHQLPEVASNFFGTSLSSRQMLELADDTITEHMREAGDMSELPEAADKLKKAALDLRLALGRDARRTAWREVAALPEVTAAMQQLRDALTALQKRLEPAAVRGKGLENCQRRTGELLVRLDSLTGAKPENHVIWFETYTKSFTLNSTPLDIAEIFRARTDAKKCAWIFTSATLAVGGSFEHFASRLGLHDAVTKCWDSPFNFSRNAVFYAPLDMPDPSSPNYIEALVEAALPVLEASRGRAFLLFTSHRALQEAHERLQGRVAYPLLVQGSAPRGELVERFRAMGNAILLGTSSFWEGVDVRGPALSCVIIDKLPFASPGDPVLQARLDALRAQGGNPFMDYQLPHAVITLKQGVGRLIRDVNDRGVMMLCDPRLFSKPYGRTFINSLPPMIRTRKLENVQRFFELETQCAAPMTTEA